MVAVTLTALIGFAGLARLIHQRDGRCYGLTTGLRNGRSGRLLGEPRFGPADVSGVAGCESLG